jgi:Xaa-Pro dipeptidase
MIRKSNVDALGDFADRRSRLTGAAAALGINHLLVCHPLNLYYLSGAKLTPYERFIGLMMDLESGDSVLILPSLEKGCKADPALTIQYYKDDQDPCLLVADLLGSGHKLGIEKDYLPLSQVENLALAKGVCGPDLLGGFTDIGILVTELRLIKKPMEIKLHHKAARCSDEILKQVAPKIQSGQTEKQIAARIMLAMSQMAEVSSEDLVVLVQAGINTAHPHGVASDYVIKAGDPILVDFGVCREGYWSDCTRTFFAGSPSAKLEEIYQIVLRANQAAIAAVKPGIPLAEIDRAAREVIAKAGYGEHFIHRTGHGLGLSIHEGPSVHANNQDLAQEGMIFTVEPGIYIPGLGGIRIEDDVVIEAEEGKVLNRYPKDFEKMILEE